MNSCRYVVKIPKDILILNEPLQIHFFTKRDRETTTIVIQCRPGAATRLSSGVSRSIMDGIASEVVLTHGVPLPQDVRLFSVLRREYKRLCAALRSFDLWFCMRDGVARNVCARSARICAHRALHSIGKYVIA